MSMGVRIISVLIVGFWLVMTGLLVRMVYFPESSRQAVVPAQQLFDSFPEDSQPLFYDVWQGRDRTGELSLNCRTRRATDGKILVLDWNSTIQVSQGLLPQGDLGTQGELTIDSRGEVLGAAVTLRLDVMGIELRIVTKAGDELPAVTFSQNGQIRFQTEGSSLEEADPVMKALLTMAGVNMSQLAEARAAAEKEAAANPAVVRRGRFTVEDREFSGFVLHLPMGGRDGWRFYFTETGELLSIDTPLDYRVRAESLRPPGFEPPAPVLRGHSVPSKKR